MDLDLGLKGRTAVVTGSLKSSAELDELAKDGPPGPLDDASASALVYTRFSH
jgi:hypothetical protein